MTVYAGDPKYKGGRPKTFTLPERREIKKIAKSRPVEHGLPFSTWSLVKLADFLVAEGVVDDISHEGLRILLREEGVSFQRLKTWQTSRDPDYAVKKARVEHHYAIADGEVIAEEDEPEVVFCMDEFGPLNLQPHPGRQWTGRGCKHKDPTVNAPAPPRDLYAPARRPPPVRRLRPGQRPALRPHQEDQEHRSAWAPGTGTAFHASATAGSITAHNSSLTSHGFRRAVVTPAAADQPADGLRIAALREQLRRVLEITGADAVLTIRPTVEDAST